MVSRPTGQSADFPRGNISQSVSNQTSMSWTCSQAPDSPGESPVSLLPTQALGIIGSEAHPQTTLVRTLARGVARPARAAPSVLGHGSPQDYNGNSELWILLYQSAHLNIAEYQSSFYYLLHIHYRNKEKVVDKY